ncbi:MAG: DNA gyrase subunit B, partial [uncultured bacterium]
NNYLVQLALDGAQLRVNSAAPAISGTTLEALIQDYGVALQIIERLTRKYPRTVLQGLLEMPRLHVEQLHDQAAVNKWAQLLEQKLSGGTNKEKPQYKVGVKELADKNIFIPVVSIVSHGIATDYALLQTLFASGEYRHLAALAEKLDGLIEPGAYIARDGREEKIANFSAAFDWLMSEAKKGLGIQRYKGLGEMNPDQLWDTTMDPNTRRMLRVTVEDAVAADQIFTTLMGDQVEPRREFIEQGALDVVNLDV